MASQQLIIDSLGVHTCASNVLAAIIGETPLSTLKMLLKAYEAVVTESDFKNFLDDFDTKLEKFK